VRRLLAVVTLGLVVLLGVPAAHAAEYPPGSPGTGISTRPAAPGQVLELAETGGDITRELGIGAGLIVVGGTLLIVTRRRRAVRG
jgi:LPXTG-motif cell wall-anchored protein